MTIIEFERILLEKIDIKSVSALKKFPCASYQEYLDQDKKGQLDTLTNYDIDVVMKLGHPFEKIIHFIFCWAWFLIALFMLVLAFIKWNFLFLLGAPIAYVGFFFSVPGPMKVFGNLLLVFMTACCIFCWIKNYETAALLSGAYALSNFLTCFCRKHCDIIIRRSIDKSEIVLVWLVLKGSVVVFPKRQKEQLKFARKNGDYDKEMIDEKTKKNKFENLTQAQKESFGQLMQKISKELVKEDGPFRDYYENGQLEIEAFFKDGKKKVRPNYITRMVSLNLKGFAITEWEMALIKNITKIVSCKKKGFSRMIKAKGLIKDIMIMGSWPKKAFSRMACVTGPNKTYYQNGQLKEEGVCKNGFIESAMQGEFKMTVEDIFFISGKGTAVVGKIQSGMIKNGEVVFFVSKTGQKISCTIVGIEKFKKNLEKAVAGDSVGLLLSGIDKKSIEKGVVLTK